MHVSIIIVYNASAWANSTTGHKHVSKFEVSFERFCLCCNYWFCLLLSSMFALWIKILKSCVSVC